MSPIYSTKNCAGSSRTHTHTRDIIFAREGEGKDKVKHIRKVYLDVRTAAASRLTAVRVAASASSGITIAMVADAAATISYTEERKLLLLFFFFIIMTTFKTHTWHKRRSSDKDGDCDSHLLLLFRLRPCFSLPLLCWNTTCLRTRRSVVLLVFLSSRCGEPPSPSLQIK